MSCRHVPSADVDWDRADRAARRRGSASWSSCATPAPSARRWRRELDVYCLPASATQLAALGEELRFLMITSAAQVHVADAAPEDAVAAETGSAASRGRVDPRAGQR